MKFARTLSAILCAALLFTTAVMADDAKSISLFDGKSLDGWKVSENPDSFSVKDGMIVAQASGDEGEILICAVDLGQIEETKKRSSFPYRDRRVDSYKDLLKLYSE